MVQRNWFDRNVIKQVYLITLALIFFIIASSQFKFNWDVIGYVGAAYKMQGFQGLELHEMTFADIRRSVPVGIFESLIDRSNYYRNEVYKNFRVLEKQVPFYEIRPFYTWLVLVCSIFLNSVTLATAYVSALCGSVIVYMTGVYLWDLRKAYLFYFSPLMLSLVMLKYSTLSTPDTLASLIALLGLWFLIKGVSKISILLFVMLPLARPDYLILSWVVALYLPYRREIFLSLLLFVASALTYVFLMHHFDHYSYLTTFNFTLISGPTPFPDSMFLSTEFYEYAEAYLKGLYRVSGLFCFYLIVGITCLLLQKKCLIVTNEYFPAVAISFCFMLIHFALFPSGMSRSYIVFSLMELIFLFRQFDMRLREGLRRQPA